MKKKFTLRLSITAIALLAHIFAFSQQEIKFISRDTAAKGTVRFARIDHRLTPFSMLNPAPFFQKLLPLRKEDDLKQVTSVKDELQMTHTRYQQFFKGVKVEGGEYVIHAREGIVETVNGNYEPVPVSLHVAPSIRADQALERAISNIRAKKYTWNMPGNTPDGKPVPELVITRLGKESQPPVLAWSFVVEATDPYSLDRVYIDAKNGRLLERIPLLCHANAATRYSGTQIVQTQQSGSTYILRDATRGNGIVTRNLNNSELNAGNAAFATNFVDNDDNWTAAEYNNGARDNAALDAHWGLSRTYDYFNTVHSRNSYDGNGAEIRAYVHALLGGSRDNAGWHPTANILGFGDGQTTFNPVVGLDVCGHEFGHAVYQYTIYGGNAIARNGEQGAINEGFSDLWGACVDSWAASADPSKDPWLLGEQIMQNGAIGLRSLRNPNELGGADTYGGTNWTSLHNVTGVTAASYKAAGVLGFWFYRLSLGGAGLNDIGNPYGVGGIGITSASRIIYRTLAQLYLTSTSGFWDARNGTMQAAADLFGSCSNEVAQVANAWFAVGIGDPSVSNAYIKGPGSICTNTVNNYSVQTVYNATAYNWDLYPNNGFISNNGTPWITMGAYTPGSYSLTVSISTPCSNQFGGGEYAVYAQQDIPPGSCTGGGGSDQFSVAPNPARDQVTITTKISPDPHAASRSIGQYEVRIIDMTGAIKIARKVKGDVFSLNIYTGDLRPGTYIVQLWRNGKVTNKKVVILKQ